ncbi:MAG: TonB-dependent receptor [Candidatus Binatia bacterium]
MTGQLGSSIRFGLGVALAAGVAVPPAGWAQAAKSKQVSAGPLEIEEITVTAQKREENIQEAPISVTALSSEELREKGVSSVVDLGEAAPNVRISANSATASGVTVGIRGIAVPSAINPSFQTGAGLYVDGVYLVGVQGSNLDLVDLDRVEVLRGPQGTLFGRNTIAGAINFITRKPTEERSITASTEAGNYDTFKQRVTVNVPLIGTNGFLQSDALGTLSLRETVMYHHHDGYVDNVSPTNVPASGSDSLSNLNRVFTMTSLRWQPVKPLTFDYAFEYHRYRNAPWARQLTYTYPAGPVGSPTLASGAPNPLYLGPYIRTNRVSSFGANVLCNSATGDLTHCVRATDDGNHRLHMLTVSYDLGNMGPLGDMTLKSISSYRNYFHQQETDGDGSPLHVADAGSNNFSTTWSEELQLVGSAPRVHYVLGAYYYGEDSELIQRTVFLAGATNLPYTTESEIDAYAPYGQVTVTPPIFGDRLSLTGGIRYTQEQVHTERNNKCVSVISVIGGRPVNVCNSTTLPVPPSLRDWHLGAGKAFGGWDAVSPMANIAFQWTDELMTYFRVARGFKSGGFNGQTSDPRAFVIPFDPEKLLQYEAGFKSQWLDNRLRVNAAGYYSDYTGLQQNVFRASRETGVLTVLSNVDSAEIWGSELEVTAIPLRGVEVTATYGLTLGSFKKWLDQKFTANNQPIYDANNNPVLEDVADQRSWAWTPDHQASLGVTYTAPPTSVGTLSAHLDVFWQDNETFLANDSTAGAQAMEAPNYTVVNGRLQFAGIPLQQGTLDLALFGRNIFDKKYRVGGVDYGASIGFANNTYGAPRTFGLQLTYNYTAGEEPLAPPPAPVVQAAPPPPPAKKKIVLRSVHFDFDKATLKADAKPILDEAVQVLKQEGSVDIIVEGHTDSVGTDQYNLGLSRRRAETVRTYLVDHGIAKSRITAEGMGEAKPVASNDTADGRAQNRRVELHVK